MTSNRAATFSTAHSSAGRSSGITGMRSVRRRIPRNYLHDAAAREIGAGFFEAGADGVADTVFRCHDHDAAGLWSGVIGPWPAGGNAGGQIAVEGRLAHTGVAVEHGEFSQGEPARPEPIDAGAGNFGDQMSDGA